MNKDDRKLSDPGTVTLFTGSMGTGKTDIALRYAELALNKNPDLVLITNIVMMKKTRRWKIHYCNSWFEYLKLIYENPRSLLVLDEAGVFASSGYSRNGFDIGQWEVFLKLCRKFGVSVFWIDQRDVGSVPPTMREVAYYHVHKPQKFIVEVWRKMRQSKGSTQIQFRKISEKDRTNIPFDTLSPASWKDDFPVWYGDDGSEEKLTIRDLIDEVSDVNNAEVRPTMKEWFKKININHDKYRLALEREKEKAVKEGSLRVGTLKETVFFILEDDDKKGRERRGPTEIASFLHRKPPSISRIIKEWEESKKESGPK